MNQSLALLYKDPTLYEELRDDIRKLHLCSPSLVWKLLFESSDIFPALFLLDPSPTEELVKAERGDISELMTTSFSETRTTEELLPAESEEEKDDEEEEERAFQNRPYPPRVGKSLSSIYPHTWKPNICWSESLINRRVNRSLH